VDILAVGLYHLHGSAKQIVVLGGGDAGSAIFNGCQITVVVVSIGYRIAVSRKLLKMIYILLEKGQYYDPNYAVKANE